ncbi:MAG TPA: hypothetical protein VHP11_04655 [Tepidisphaeraceae bacterium]|nr:hypothetical protein [Tepidisphaeraceae bacterium]
MAGCLKSAGFEVEEIMERRSKYPSRYAYMVAKKSGSKGEVL